MQTLSGALIRLEILKRLRATKLIINLKNMSYTDRLKRLNLSTLKYRRLRGDMIEVFKITHDIYDSRVSLKLPYHYGSITRGNKYKILNHRFHYDLRKHYFSTRINCQYME